MRARWASHSAAGHGTVPLGITWVRAKHCTALLSIARMVLQGTAQCHQIFDRSKPSIARGCRALRGAAGHCRGLQGIAPARARHGPEHPDHLPAPCPPPSLHPSPAPLQERPRCCQQRIVLGARSPCPADGRYNKAACCGQANYLSNYDLPLNHMIFLQSCGQLKPG